MQSKASNHEGVPQYSGDLINRQVFEIERIRQARAVEHGAGGEGDTLKNVADFAGGLVLAVFAFAIGDL